MLWFSLQIGNENAEVCVVGFCCPALLMLNMWWWWWWWWWGWGWGCLPPPTTPVSPSWDLQSPGHPLVQTLGKYGESRNFPLFSPGRCLPTCFVLFIPPGSSLLPALAADCLFITWGQWLPIPIAQKFQNLPGYPSSGSQVPLQPPAFWDHQVP